MTLSHTDARAPTEALVPADRDEIVATAHALADAARAETLPRFRAGISVDNKAAEGFDPVTDADRAAEAAMRAVLARRRPQDGILGEEMGQTVGTSGLTWVLDPIDGTRAFLAGAPTWGTLIAVNGPAGPLLGVIDQAWTGERWVGGLGEAAVTSPHGTTPLRAKSTARVGDALLCSTFPEIGTAAERTAFLRVAEGARMLRYGLDCYAYGLLAAGHVDLVIEAGLASYDISAPIAVIEAAGGVVTDWQGAPVHEGGRALAAATPALHAEALRRLAWAE